MTGQQTEAIEELNCATGRAGKLELAAVKLAGFEDDVGSTVKQGAILETTAAKVLSVGCNDLGVEVVVGDHLQHTCRGVCKFFQWRGESA